MKVVTTTYHKTVTVQFVTCIKVFFCCFLLLHRLFISQLTLKTVKIYFILGAHVISTCMYVFMVSMTITLKI